MEHNRFKNSFADLKWFAGFFDGEGCIYCKDRIRKVKDKEYTYPDLQVIVGQSGDIGKELCEFLQGEFGFGKITSCHGGVLTKKIPYMTRLSGRKAYHFLLDLEPFLVLKKDKAKEAISMVKDRYGKREI